MHKVASLNGNLVASESAKIRAVSSAAMYGWGIFTTIAIHGSRLFLWEKHQRRLQANAAKIGLDITEISFESIERSLDKLICENAVIDGRARVTLLDESSGRIWSNDRAKTTSVLILTGDNRSQPESLRLAISPFPVNSRSPLACVKSCNYLENILALNEARKRDFDEAIRVNEKGEVTTACMTNLFWLKAGQLFTPGLETGCLAGTTREFVLDTLDCREVRTTMSDLLNAEAMFISSVGVGIKKIACLDDKPFQPIDHDILHLLPPADTKTRMSAKRSANIRVSKYR